MRTKMKRNMTIAIVGASTILAFSGCSSGTASSSSSAASPSSSTTSSDTTAVYDFPTNGIKPASSFKIVIPEDLRRVMGPAETDKLLVNSFTVRSHKVDGAKYCALDITVDYAKDGATALSAEDKAVPAYKNLVSSLGFDEAAKSANIFKESAPEPGTYVSDDLKTITSVTKCAASPTDRNNATFFGFPTQGNHDAYGISEIYVSTMTDGTLGVTGKIKDFMRDANGNWIAD